MARLYPLFNNLDRLTAHSCSTHIVTFSTADYLPPLLHESMQKRLKSRKRRKTCWRITSYIFCQQGSYILAQLQVRNVYEVLVPQWKQWIFYPRTKINEGRQIKLLTTNWEVTASLFVWWVLYTACRYRAHKEAGIISLFKNMESEANEIRPKYPLRLNKPVLGSCSPGTQAQHLQLTRCWQHCRALLLQEMELGFSLQVVSTNASSVLMAGITSNEIRGRNITAWFSVPTLSWNAGS